MKALEYCKSTFYWCFLVSSNNNPNLLKRIVWKNIQLHSRYYIFVLMKCKHYISVLGWMLSMKTKATRISVDDWNTVGGLTEELWSRKKCKHHVYKNNLRIVYNRYIRGYMYSILIKVLVLGWMHSMKTPVTRTISVDDWNTDGGHSDELWFRKKSIGPLTQFP